MKRWVILGLILGCQEAGVKDGAQVTKDITAFTMEEEKLLAELRLRPSLPSSPTNIYGDNEAAARLGHRLFFDQGLSPTGEVSCATCHQPEKHFSDGLQRGVGAGETKRHTPTIVGAQRGEWFFWDGRSDSLWAQALQPMEHHDEMGSDRVWVVRHVSSTYKDEYEQVFGPMGLPEEMPDRARPVEDDADHPLNIAWIQMSDVDQVAVNRVFVNVAKSMEAYERRLLPEEAPFDRFVDAYFEGDSGGGGHLNDQAIAGLKFFLGEGNCTACHSGPDFSDRAFHTLGMVEDRGYDPGRTGGAVGVLASPFNCDGDYSDAKDCPELRYLNPKFPDFRGAFKTPTLRYVAETAPYMHNGLFQELEDVLNFYSTLPGEPMLNHRELTLRPLNLSQAQTEGLIQFLKSLTGAPLPMEWASPPEDAF